MLASAGRSRSGDRFYNPPAVRRQLQLQQQEQEQEQQQQVISGKQKLGKNKQIHEQQRLQRPARIHSTKSSGESDDCASSTSAAATLPASVSSYSASGSGSIVTNLDRFLDYTTPLVPGQHSSKANSMTEWRTQEDELQPYFVLGDLWESFKEWSTFGAGVPLLLNGSDSVVQYYVPYLSGIQLYEYPVKHKSSTRNTGQECDLDSSRESSDGSSDFETGRKLEPCLQGVRSQQVLEASRQGIKGLSMSNKMSNGCHNDEAELVSSQGVLAFEYLERDPPYNREPLVSLLASRFPQLMTYRSCDLSPASWVSVAWYPIYRIPIGPTLQSLDSCFLTFHSLSKPVHEAQNEWQHPHGSHPRDARHGFDIALKLSLPIFGLASYKFKTSVWERNGADDSPKANMLCQAAADWLQHMNVNHPDYSFFSSYRSYQR
ncbi:hypothetical protein V2J09_017862 [Rumex salicifolius]